MMLASGDVEFYTTTGALHVDRLTGFLLLAYRHVIGDLARWLIQNAEQFAINCDCVDSTDLRLKHVFISGFEQLSA